MSILITGGAGFIGSATVAAARERGDKVVVLDNLSAGHPESLPADVPLVRGDLADRDLVRDVIRDHRVDRVIHFAAFTSVPESVEHPGIYFENNTMNTLGLLEVMRDASVDQIIYSSTAATYGEPEHSPIGEDHPTQPTNPYGHSKRFSELIMEAFDRAWGLRHVALRYFNAAGGSPTRGEDHDPETHLVPLILQVALCKRDSIAVFGDDYPTADGTCVRDYVHIDDLAQAHLKALDYLAGGGESRIINLGNGCGYSVLEVIETARRITGHPISSRVEPRRAGDPSTLVASSERAREVLGWEPAYPDLDTIVASAWDWHCHHPDGYVGK
jgi:UDP-glucose 4-epimerase